MNNSLVESNKQYISNPAVFGPGRWDILHSYSSLCKTKEDKIQFANFVENIFTPTIKCIFCRNHFQYMLQKYPVPFGSRPHPKKKEWDEQDSVYKWTFSVHNLVNERLNKPIMSWDVYQELYGSDSKACTNCIMFSN